MEPISGTLGGNQQVADLLDQLGRGLSAFSLFPDDPDRPAFLTAVERIRSAAQAALSAGPVTVGVHGGGFVLPGRRSARSDASAQRLALALFDRRVERLEVRALPDRQDLAAFYRAVSTSPPEIDAAGGMETLLRGLGVVTIVAAGVEPEPEAPLPLDDDQRTLWTRLQDPRRFAEDALARIGAADAGRQASELFVRLEDLLARLPREQADSPAVFGRFQDVLAHVPEDTRRAFNVLAVARLAEDRLAQGYLGTMTDAELARTIVGLGPDGPHPIDLARQLVQLGARHADIVDLTSALLLSGEQRGTILPSPSAGADQARGAASEMLARGVALSSDEDVAALRTGFPTTDLDRRADAHAALRDYLQNEDDERRLRSVLDAWTGALRESLELGDSERVEQLVGAMRAAGAGIDGDRRVHLDRYAAGVLDAATVATLVDRARLEGFEALRPLLAPLADPAVDRLFDVLADEPDAGVRAQLVALIADLVRAGDGRHLQAVARRLDDQRWYVVRNAVTVLQRVGTGDTIHLITRASRHALPLVRREAVRALVAVAGTAAVGVLEQLAQDPDADVRTAAIQAVAGLASSEAAETLARIAQQSGDVQHRRRALDALARHPAPPASGLLAELASRRGGTSLPWTLRRHARALVRQRRGP